MRTTLRLPLSALALALLLVSGACGQPDSAGDSALNEADVAFLQMMIPHHQQATEMTDFVADNTDRAELLELSETIMTTQSAEVEQMRTLLDAAGENPDTGMDGMDHGGMEMGADMPGMMDEASMRKLEQLQGEEFDLAFLDMMTEHHRGAITMAETVIAEGDNSEVQTLASEIIAAQQAEITQMEEWRQAWA